MQENTGLPGFAQTGRREDCFFPVLGPKGSFSAEVVIFPCWRNRFNSAFQVTGHSISDLLHVCGQSRCCSRHALKHTHSPGRGASGCWSVTLFSDNGAPAERAVTPPAFASLAVSVIILSNRSCCYYYRCSSAAAQPRLGSADSLFGFGVSRRYRTEGWGLQQRPPPLLTLPSRGARPHARPFVSLWS